MADLNSSDRDVQRLRQEYARRATDGSLSDKYSPDNPAYNYMIEQRRQAVRSLLDHYLTAGLSNLTILEIGCGTGGVLSEFQEFGAHPNRLFGLDLLHDRLTLARQRLALASFVCGNGQQLPFPANSIDLLLQFTAFSSILDETVKMQMASEMSRILRPGGTVIWYDFTWNPTNLQTKGIQLSEIKALFSGFTIFPSRITLAPPLTRLLIPKFRSLADRMASLKFLNSHLLVWIQKPAQDLRAKSTITQ